MGSGVGKVLNAPFKMAERAVRSTVRHPREALARAIPVVAGTMTGNPWLAAGAGAIGGAIGDGGTRGVLMGAVGSGLGAHLGAGVADSLQGTAIGKFIGNGELMRDFLVGQGAGMGMLSTQKLEAARQMQQAYEPPMTGLGEVLSAPSFPELKAEAMAATEQAVQESGIGDILNNNRLRNRGRWINIYNRKRFPSLRNLMKKRIRAQQMARIGSV